MIVLVGIFYLAHRLFVFVFSHLVVVPILLEGEDVKRDSGAVTDAKQDSSSVMSKSVDGKTANRRTTEVRRSYKEALTCKIK